MGLFAEKGWIIKFIIEVIESVIHETLKIGFSFSEGFREVLCWTSKMFISFSLYLPLNMFNYFLSGPPFLCLCLSVCPSLSLPACLSTHSSICACLSLSLSIKPVCLSVRVFLCARSTSVSLSRPLSLFSSLPACPAVRLFERVWLSLSLCLSLVLFLR